MTTLELHDPTGGIEITRLHAPRLDTLDGKKIGFITNQEWQAHRTLPLLRSLIEADFPTAELLAVDLFPTGNEKISKQDTIDRVTAAGVDAVVVGAAA
jgi:hypothetical protein